MKQLVLNMALIIIAQKGNTSTLEVKNALFDVFHGEGNPNGIGHTPVDSTFRTSQKEISDLMGELYVEQNWNRVMNTSGPNHFYEYSIPSTVSQPLPVGVYASLAPATQQTVAAIINDTFGPNTVPTPAPIAAQPAATTTTKVPALSSANGDCVAYVKNHPELFIQGTDMKTVRRQCFQKHNPTQVGLSYDDIYRCSVARYNKRNA